MRQAVLENRSRRFVQGASGSAGNAGENGFRLRFHALIQRVDAQFRKVGRQSADAFGDAHFIVVENHGEVAPAVARVVQSFERESRRHGSVADHRKNAFLRRFPGEVTGDGEAIGGGNTGSRVSRSEQVEFAFFAAQEAGNPRRTDAGY